MAPIYPMYRGHHRRGRRNSFPNTPGGRSSSNIRLRSGSRSRSRSRSSSMSGVSLGRGIANYVQDAAMQAASMVLDHVSPVPGAGLALNVARGVHRYASRAAAANTPRTAARNQARGATSVYRGRMKKARRVYRDPYVTKGFKHVTEVNGFVSDPDCVYVGHQANAPYDAIEICIQSLLRKLFEKAGLTITSVNQQLKYQSTNTSLGWRLEVSRIDAESGAVNQYAYNLGVNDSIASIVGQKNAGVAPLFPLLVNVFLDYATGQLGEQAVNIIEPLRLELFGAVKDTIGGGDNSPYVLMSQLNLREAMVHFTCTSIIKVQNRSLSASGSEDAESVSANTLRMVKYAFDGVPRQRDATAMLGLPVAETGILTTGAANGGNPYLKEPVSPKLFWNCKGVVGGKLNPGEMRSDKITWTKSMYLLKFLRYVGYSVSEDRDPGPGTITYQSRAKGPFMLYAFEDMINVNANELITVAYEVNRSIGCYIGTKRVTFATGGVYSLVQDSAAPA